MLKTGRRKAIRSGEPQSLTGLIVWQKSNSCGEVIKSEGHGPLCPSLFLRPCKIMLGTLGSLPGSGLMWARSHFSIFWDFRSYIAIAVMYKTENGKHTHSFKTMTGRCIQRSLIKYVKVFLILPLESSYYVKCIVGSTDIMDQE